MQNGGYEQYFVCGTDFNEFLRIIHTIQRDGRLSDLVAELPEAEASFLQEREELIHQLQQHSLYPHLKAFSYRSLWELSDPYLDLLDVDFSWTVEEAIEYLSLEQLSDLQQLFTKLLSPRECLDDLASFMEAKECGDAYAAWWEAVENGQDIVMEKKLRDKVAEWYFFHQHYFSIYKEAFQQLDQQGEWSPAERYLLLEHMPNFERMSIFWQEEPNGDAPRIEDWITSDS